MKSVPSIHHQCLKLPSPTRVKTFQRCQKYLWACYMNNSRKIHFSVLYISKKVVEKASKRNMTSWFASLGSTSLALLTSTIVSSKGVFASETNSSPYQGCASFIFKTKPRYVCFNGWRYVVDQYQSHIPKLNADPNFKLIKQKLQKLSTEFNDAVYKLLKFGSIREVKHHDWLANPVFVKRKNEKLRVCIYLTNINKACPKESFPLPHIHRLVEAATENEFLSFIDAFSVYNQILMNLEYQEKTSSL